MSFPYTPTQNPKPPGWGWWPVPSPDGQRAAHGNGRMYTYNADTGVMDSLHDPQGSSLRGQAGGWFDDDEIVFAIGEANARLYAHNMRTGVDRALSLNVNVSRAPSAGHGHWACAYAGGDVYYDGIRIDTGVGYYISCDGDWLALRGNDGVHIYKSGLWQRTVPFAPNTTSETPSAWWEGVIGYAYNCAPQMLDTTKYASPSLWKWTDIAVTPKRKESCPRFVRANGVLWCATSSEDYGVLLRPAGDSTVIIVALPFVPNDCQLNWDGGQFIVTAWNSGGNLTVIAVDPNAPREVLVAPPDPTMRDVIGHGVFQVDGQTVEATVTIDPSGGTLRDVRFLIDRHDGQGLKTHPPGDNQLTHQYLLDPGTYTLGVKLVGVNGVAVMLPTQDVTIAPIVVPPVVVPPTYADPASHRGLNAGNCTDLLGEAWMDDLKAHGVTLDRRDGCNVATTRERLALVDAECWRVGIRPLYLGNLTLMSLLPDGAWFEFWSGTNPLPGQTGGASVSGTQYAREACQVLDYCKTHSIRPFFGVLDNLNDDWLAKNHFLDLMIIAMGPRWAEIVDFSAHWYPDGPGQPFNSGHSGRKTKQDDVNALRARIGQRTLLMTEVGYHNATVTAHDGFLGKHTTTWTLSESDVLSRLRQEDAFWKAQPHCLGWCIYQIVDAPRAAPKYDSPINRFGLRRAPEDGAGWKLQSGVWT